jgi:hypothetical protein
MRKTAVWETVDAEINNIICMELYSGAKMADGKYRKTYVAGLIDRENTVYDCLHVLTVSPPHHGVPLGSWKHQSRIQCFYWELNLCCSLHNQ